MGKDLREQLISNPSRQTPVDQTIISMLFNKRLRISVKDKLRIINSLEKALVKEELSWSDFVRSEDFQKAKPHIDKRAVKILEKKPDNQDGPLNGMKAIKKTLLRAEVNILKEKWGMR